MATNRSLTVPTVILLAGLLPIVAAHAAYLLNVYEGTGLAAKFLCMPYLDGCVSISRAARSGPGLKLFQTLMLPSALLLFLSWGFVRQWLADLQACGTRQARTIAALGVVGALFLVAYVTALGNEDEWYRWQRRYGVILYFGGTALAQLLLVWVLWPAHRHRPPRRAQGPDPVQRTTAERGSEQPAAGAARGFLIACRQRL